MISISSSKTPESERISSQKEVDEFFKQIGAALSRPVQVLLIGGAAMLESRLKESTKDIDVVCRTEEDRDEILRCTHRLGYHLVGPKDRHARLGLNRIAIKGGRTLDVFARRISYDFGLSDAMWNRARRIRFFDRGRGEVRLFWRHFHHEADRQPRGRYIRLRFPDLCRSGFQRNLRGDSITVSQGFSGSEPEDLDNLSGGGLGAA